MTSTRPFFTVVTATHDAVRLLPRTRASLAAQSMRDFEWRVVDGASTDGTVALLSSYGGELAGLVTEPDRGIADAWNKGIRAARGEYVLLLNAGDEYTADALAELRRVALEHPGAIVCAHAVVLGEDGAPLRVFRARPERLWRGMHVPHCCCAVPATAYAALGPYREMPLAMDFEWFHRFYRARGVAGFRVVDRALARYHLGGVSDRRYRESFRANASVLVENGTPRILAALLRIAYTARHARAARRGSHGA